MAKSLISECYKKKKQNYSKNAKIYLQIIQPLKFPIFFFFFIAFKTSSECFALIIKQLNKSLEGFIFSVFFLLPTALLGFSHLLKLINKFESGQN